MKKVFCILSLLFVIACSSSLQDRNLIVTGFDESAMEQYKSNKDKYGIIIIKVSISNQDRDDAISNTVYSKTTAFETTWIYEENKKLKETKWFNISSGRVIGNGMFNFATMVVKGVDSSIAENQGYRVLLLEPGIYNMKNYVMYNVNRLGFESTYLAENGFDKVYASFEVKPGEILYVGDIKLSMQNMYIMSMMGNDTRLGIDISDNLDNAVNFVKNNYKNIDIKKIEKRLMKNYTY